MSRKKRKANQREIICRYGGACLNDIAPTPKKSNVQREWCEKGVTCNRPSDPMRDEIGLSELEERLWLNFGLLKSWNEWTRSPYCQCSYSSGQRPSTEYCRHCNRPVTPESARALTAVENEEHERIRRLRAGRTWIVVYENTVRAAEVALKLLIKATGPAPEGEAPHLRKARPQGIVGESPSLRQGRSPRRNALWSLRSELHPCHFSRRRSHH